MDSSVQAMPGHTFKHARILIVDDEPSNIDVLRRMLDRPYPVTSIRWILTQRPSPPLTGHEETGGACPIGAPGRREGGWNLGGSVRTER